CIGPLPAISTSIVFSPRETAMLLTVTIPADMLGADSIVAGAAFTAAGFAIGFAVGFSSATTGMTVVGLDATASFPEILMFSTPCACLTSTAALGATVISTRATSAPFAPV